MSEICYLALRYFKFKTWSQGVIIFCYQSDKGLLNRAAVQFEVVGEVCNSRGKVSGPFSPLLKIVIPGGKCLLLAPAQKLKKRGAGPCP